MKGRPTQRRLDHFPEGPPTDSPGNWATAGVQIGSAILPAGFQNSAMGLDLGFYTACPYSLMRPPRTGRRVQAAAALGPELLHRG
jgi:hypothetical protein